MSLFNQCVRECKTFMTTSQQEKDSSVCLRLKSEREAAKLTQQEIATALEVSIKTVTRWERAIPIPSDKLGSLVRLGLDAFYILTGERMRTENVNEERSSGGVYAKSRTASTAEPLNYRERAVLDCMRQLKPEHQRMLEGIAQSMLKTQKEQQVIEDFTSGNDGKKIGEDWWPGGAKD